MTLRGIVSPKTHTLLGRPVPAPPWL